MTGATVEFRFESRAAEARFLETYLADAWERFESSDHWESGWFWPYGEFAAYDAGPEGGFVRLVFEGDPGAFTSAEADRWEAVDGLVSWECRRYDAQSVGEGAFESLRAQQRDAKGSAGGDFEYRYKPLTARFALAYRRAFEDPLDPAPSPTDANPSGIGMWSLVHALFVQCGYDWYDETDACLRAMRNRLKSIAAYRGADAAREEHDRLARAWSDARDDLEAWIEANPTGTQSVGDGS